MFLRLSRRRTLTNNHHKSRVTQTRRTESPLLLSDSARLYSTILHLLYTRFHGIWRPTDVILRLVISRRTVRNLLVYPTLVGLVLGVVKCVVDCHQTRIRGKQQHPLASINTLSRPTNEFQVCHRRKNIISEYGTTESVTLEWKSNSVRIPGYLVRGPGLYTRYNSEPMTKVEENDMIESSVFYPNPRGHAHAHWINETWLTYVYPGVQK